MGSDSTDRLAQNAEGLYLTGYDYLSGCLGFIMMQVAEKLRLIPLERPNQKAHQHDLRHVKEGRVGL